MKELSLSRLVHLWDNRRHKPSLLFYRGLNIAVSKIIPMEEVTPEVINLCTDCKGKDMKRVFLEFLKDMKRRGRYPEALIVSPSGFTVIWKSHIPEFFAYLKRTEGPRLSGQESST